MLERSCASTPASTSRSGWRRSARKVDFNFGDYINLTRPTRYRITKL